MRRATLSELNITGTILPQTVWQYMTSSPEPEKPSLGLISQESYRFAAEEIFISYLLKV